MKVMVVDDEQSLLRALELIFSNAGFEYIGICQSTKALEAIEDHRPDVVILDVMMPGINGFELCEAIRNRQPEMPILMLSAKCDIVDRHVGLRAGADDYLAKPFDDEELLLRVKALLRRAHRESTTPGSTPIHRSGAPRDLIVNAQRCEVLVHGKPVALTPKEFKIVELLAAHPGQVFTRDEIRREVWGDQFRDSSISIPSYVRRIREKIEQNPSEPVLLQTVFGFGYRIGS